MAIVAALSPQPTRWFVRIALLTAGVVVGVREIQSLALPNRMEDSGRGARLRRWLRLAVAFVLASEVTGLAFRYLTRDALRYFDFQEATFGPLWPRRLWLIAHICGGMLALVLGPVQFWTGLRVAVGRFHRWTGRAYLLGVVLAAGSAFHLAPFISPEEGGWLSGLSMMVLATVWLAATALALRAILHRQIAGHREWMTRSYVLAFAFVNIRWLIELPSLSAFGTPAQRIPAIIWAAWAGPLFLTEVALQWRRTGFAVAKPLEG